MSPGRGTSLDKFLAGNLALQALFDERPELNNPEFLGFLADNPLIAQGIIEGLRTTTALNEINAGAAGTLDDLGDRFRDFDPLAFANEFRGQFASDPFVHRTQASIRATLDDPDVISDEETAQLKSRIVDSILGGVRSAQIGVRENLASRGILDSGAALGAIRKSQEGAARDIAAGEREVDIERFLARAARETEAQNAALAMSQQIGHFGLNEATLGLNASQIQLAAFRGELPLGLALAQMAAGESVFEIPFFEFSQLARLDEEIRQLEDGAEKQRKIDERNTIIGTIGRLILTAFGPKIFDTGGRGDF